MKTIIHFVFLAGLSMLFTNCKKPKKDDPCTSAHPVTAHFKIEETEYFPSHGQWVDYETDTTMGYNVKFTADEDNAQYEWHIGAGVYTTRVVNLDFMSAPDHSVIPITLIVNKEPAKTCFPEDDGKDTFSKDLVINKTSKFLYSSFRGVYTDSPKDSFTIKSIDSGYSGAHPAWENLVRGYTIFAKNGSLYGYGEAIIYQQSFDYPKYPFYRMQAKGFMTGNKVNFRIVYHTDLNNFNDSTVKYFVGHKIK